ncbi:MAG: glycosyltransferase family 39 protein [bacterium]|nr:glycosyltransferase family 39 protein [bacterium]
MSQKSTFEPHAASVVGGNAKAFVGGRVWLLVWLCVLAIVFIGSFGISPYADDWGSLVQARDEVSAIERDGRWSVLLSTTGSHWSPGIRVLDDFSYALVRSTSDTVIRIYCMLAHGWGMVFVFLFVRSLNLKRGASMLAMLVFAFHQAAVSPIYAYDMSSAAVGTALVWGAILLLLHAKGPKQVKGQIAAGALFLVGLLCKETSLAFIPMACVVLLYQEGTVSRRALRKVLVRMLPFLGVASMFLIARAVMGAPTLQMGTGSGASARYRVAGPLVWGQNALQLGLAQITPMSTVWWFTAIKKLQVNELLVLAAATGLSALAILIGTTRFARNGYLREVLLILGLIIGSWFPVLLMGHVAESYTYAGLPFIGVLVGISAQGLLSQGHSSHRAKWAGRFCLMILPLSVVTHAVSQRSKLSLMHESGNNSRFWYGKMTSALRNVPAGSEVVYYREPANELAYSHFLEPRWYVSVPEVAVEWAYPWKFGIQGSHKELPDNDLSTLHSVLPEAYILRREGEKLTVEVPWEKTATPAGPGALLKPRFPGDDEKDAGLEEATLSEWQGLR